jgi:putative ABC transport system permease protein
MIRRLACLFEYLFRRRRLENDLDEEVRSSFEMMVDQFVARGMSLAEARRVARIEFEGLEQVKERVRDGLVGSVLQAFLQDVVYAWRGLRRSPSFAIIALVTLALGIGVNTAIFSVFYGVLLHPLPYDQPGRLVRIWASYRDAGARAPLSGPMLGEIERRNRSLAAVGAIWVVAPRTFTGDDPEQVKSARVTVNFFDVLGVHAAHGRTFTKEDAGAPAVMLIDSTFRRRFGANPGLVGKGLPMQDAAATLVGVLPAEFQLQFAPDANVPADKQVFDPFGPNVRSMSGRFLRLVARLKPGVTLADAQRDLDRVSAEVRAASTALADNQLQFRLAGLQADAFGDIQPALTALFAGAAFVLLICCVNVTSLLLARASDRRKEIALRLTLGASRGRILRQLLAEGIVLCILGGAAGIAVAWAGFRGLLAIRPERLARIAGAGLSWPVLAFAGATSLADRGASVGTRHESESYELASLHAAAPHGGGGRYPKGSPAARSWRRYRRHRRGVSLDAARLCRAGGSGRRSPFCWSGAPIRTRRVHRGRCRSPGRGRRVTPKSKPISGVRAPDSRGVQQAAIGESRQRFGRRDLKHRP